MIMTTALIIFGILLALWSGFIMGYYKREGKTPDIQLPNILAPIVEAMEKKKGKPDKEEEKVNSFFN